VTLTVDALDPFDDAALRAWYDVYRAAESFGREFHTAYAFEEKRAEFRVDHVDVRHQGLVASRDGEVVGVASVSLPLMDNLGTALVEVGVRPEHRRQGIGSALFAGAEEIAREAGRVRILSEVSFPIGLPADGAGHPGVEFVRRHGFVFGLGSIQRVLDLPVPPALLAELSDRAAVQHDGYTFRQYVGPLPDDLVEPVGRLRGAMDDEAPAGEIVREGEVHDELRVRAEEAALAEGGRTRVGTVAIAPSGEAAGYTEYVVPEFDPPWVYQWGTLVWPEHRGHSLGLALKVRNTAQVQAAHPDRRAERTWNAEVNTPMIAVNEAMGFRPVERLGEYQLDLV
jgi:GNAT superfamily N-acetyltransferase